MNTDIGVIFKKDYPETLREAKGSPKSLYLRGSLPPTHYKYLCVIGSRKATSYGESAVKKIIGGLKGYPVSIVSGLAFGIDAIAHQAALEAGLHCTAFPGSSLDWDEVYPREHEGLARMIVDNGGALMSEWEPGYPTGKWAFPARNRLMAGLSHATLIIEAGRKSGSLMTAKHAEECSRDVYAVPGPIDAPLSYGPHMLIQRGAALVSSSRDVLEELGFKVPRSTKGAGRATGDAESQTQLPMHIAEDRLSSAVMKMLFLEDLTVEMLLEKTSATARALNEKLSLLELEGLVRIYGGTVTMIR